MRVATTLRGRRCLRSVVTATLMSAYYDDARAGRPRPTDTSAVGDRAVEPALGAGAPPPPGRPLLVDPCRPSGWEPMS
jgi:hypothetical protein